MKSRLDPVRTIRGCRASVVPEKESSKFGTQTSAPFPSSLVTVSTYCRYIHCSLYIPTQFPPSVAFATHCPHLIGRKPLLYLNLHTQTEGPHRPLLFPLQSSPSEPLSLLKISETDAFDRLQLGIRSRGLHHLGRPGQHSTKPLVCRNRATHVPFRHTCSRTQ